MPNSSAMDLDRIAQDCEADSRSAIDAMEKSLLVQNLPLKSKTKPGPKQHERERLFDFLAGNLWRQTLDTWSASKVPLVQLLEIAEMLDAARFVPPADYLEVRRAARRLSAQNSANAQKQKARPILSWTALVKQKSPKLIRAMKRTLARCASKASA